VARVAEAGGGGLVQPRGGVLGAEGVVGVLADEAVCIIRDAARRGPGGWRRKQAILTIAGLLSEKLNTYIVELGII
jgi:hypothetical protein